MQRAEDADGYLGRYIICRCRATGGSRCKLASFQARDNSPRPHSPRPQTSADWCGCSSRSAGASHISHLATSPKPSDVAALSCHSRLSVPLPLRLYCPCWLARLVPCPRSHPSLHHCPPSSTARPRARPRLTFRVSLPQAGLARARRPSAPRPTVPSIHSFRPLVWIASQL